MNQKLYFTPEKAFIGAISVEGASHIHCLDKCLMKVGLGNVSLIKITSVLPPNVQIVTSLKEKLPMGCNIPAVYTYNISSKEGKSVAAAIGIGKTETGPTLVAECSGKKKKNVQKDVRTNLKRMIKFRSLNLEHILVKATGKTVKRDHACAFAIIAEVL